jgi:hypothetical protein
MQLKVMAMRNRKKIRVPFSQLIAENTNTLKGINIKSTIETL